MKGIYLLLGSNLGNRPAILDAARGLITDCCGPIIKCSSIYESAPWGDKNQPAFLNQVIEIESDLEALALLSGLQDIEIQLGRKRFRKWGERKIDIDILYYGDQIVNTELLTVPHPEIPNRKFTLQPLNEIAPSFVHPQLKIDQNQLLTNSSDPLWVKKTDPSAVDC